MCLEALRVEGLAIPKIMISRFNGKEDMWLLVFTSKCRVVCGVHLLYFENRAIAGLDNIQKGKLLGLFTKSQYGVRKCWEVYGIVKEIKQN